MGGQLSIPNKKNVRGNVHNLILEYQSIALTQVEDAYDFWQQGGCNGNTKMSLSAFDEVFCNILADPEAHFSVFKDYIGTSANPQDLFLVLAQFVDCSPTLRLNFLVKVALGRNGIVSLLTKDVQNLAMSLLLSVHKLFDIKVPDTNALNNYISNGLSAFLRRTSIDAENILSKPLLASSGMSIDIDEKMDLKTENDENGEPSNIARNLATTTISAAAGGLEIEIDLVQLGIWIQDSQEVSAFLKFPQKYFQSAHGSGHERPADARALESDLSGAHIHIDDKSYEFLRRHQSSLWTRNVLDMVDESWCVDHPQLHGKDAFFLALEHLFLSAHDEKNANTSYALIVRKYGRSIATGHMPGSHGANTGAGTAGSSTPFKHKLQQTAHTLHGSTRKDAHKDREREQKSSTGSTISAFNLMAASNATHTGLSASASALLRAGISPNLAWAMAQPNLASNEGIFDVFDATAACAMFAQACPAGIVDKALDPKYVDQTETLHAPSRYALRRNTTSDDESIWTDAGHKLATTTLDEVHDCIFLLHRPRMLLAQILHIDHQVYNVVNMFAHRYRAVPIASNPSKPRLVTHLLQGLHMVRFLYRHEIDLFDQDLYRSVMEIGIVRKTRTVPQSTNLATALTVLSRLDTESCLVVNDDGGVCGMVHAEIVRNIWLLCWQRSHAQSTSAGPSWQDLSMSYSCDTFAHYDGSQKGLSALNILTRPLSECNAVSLQLEAFRTYAPPTAEEVQAMRADWTLAQTAARVTPLQALSPQTKLGGALRSVTKYLSVQGVTTESARESMPEAATVADKAKRTGKSKRRSVSNDETAKQQGKPSKKSKKGKRGKKQTLTAEELAALRARRALELETATTHYLRSHRAEYDRWLDDWFSKHCAIRHNDTLHVALMKMCEYRCTKVFLISAETGLPQGSLSLVDLCRLALETETAIRSSEFTTLRRRRKDDVVVMSDV